MPTILNKIFQPIRKRLDDTAMYRTVTLALLSLVFCSLVLGFVGIFPYSGLEQLISLFTALAVALSANVLLSKLLKVHVNNESAIITALILFFLVIPPQISNLSDLWQISVVVLLAILSKFLLVWNKQHLFNPAAFGVFALALIYELFPINGYFETVWWIGKPELFIPLLIAGSLLVFKIRRWTPVLVFIGVAFVMFLFEEWRFGSDVLAQAPNFWLSGPSLFLAFFMLTEPFTMPPTKRLQAGYGAVLGFLAQTTMFLPVLKMTPELALIISNLLFYPTTLKRKLILPLVEKRELATNTYEFAFAKPKGLTFKAGQYLEWMLPHSGVDNRGIRRYFTIASAPNDDLLRIGVRFADTVSSFKTKLKSLEVGDKIIASQLAGDFVLPKNPNIKLAFIAGGIGITPFVSHLGYMAAAGGKFNTILFNCNNTSIEIAYKDNLREASEKIACNVVNILAKENLPGYESGFLTADMVKKYSPDYLERHWYISGPPPMVSAYSQLLTGMGVPGRQIVTDFFPGLA